MSLEVNHLSKYYGQQAAISDCSLHASTGELLAVVGPSGCGKTTMLRIVAGLLAESSGSVVLDGRPVAGVPTRFRELAFIMDDLGLYPYMDVRSNVGYPLRVRKVPAHEVSQRVNAIAASLGIDGILDRMPSQLSGGQRQRVAIARALVRDDVRFMLADEPFSDLDAPLRWQLRAEFKDLQRKRGWTCLFVTHDQEEALSLGDRVAVMNAGRIVQIATGHELYARPLNAFVAGFIGQPPINMVSGEIVDGRCAVLGVDLGIEPAESKQQHVIAGVRAEDVRIQLRPSQFAGDVVLVEGSEPDHLVHLNTDGVRIVARVPSTARLAAGRRVAFEIAADAWHLFDRDTGERVPTRVCTSKAP